MSQSTRVKICGLRTAADVLAAADAGARYVGLVSFPRSPRHMMLPQAAALAQIVPAGICKVALVVNPDDAQLQELINTVAVDMIQLHGSESPERVIQVRKLTGLPVMKAIGIADEDDLAALDVYQRVADQILVDAKPARNAALPGGNGLSFDWTLLQGRRWTKPWMLAGGLTPLNVAEAVERTGAQQVDVSSGVESAPGIKDADLIRDFVVAAQG